MTIKESALFYATKLGWAVFPLNGKVPFAGSNGCKDATKDPKVIEKMWRDHPRANVAIATGEISDLLVIDVDIHPEEEKFGSETLADLEKDLGDLPVTAEVLTGSGGRHLYFHYPEGSGITIGEGTKSGLGVGLDFRGNGGYVVAPPSIHPETGRRYEWEASWDPFEDPELTGEA